MDSQKMFESFKNLAKSTGAEKVAKRIMGDELYEEVMGWTEGEITNQLLTLVVIFVILMIIGIILGSLETPLQNAIPDNSTFAGLKTTLPQNLNSAMNIAVIIPIVLAAILILGVVYMMVRS